MTSAAASPVPSDPNEPETRLSPADRWPTRDSFGDPDSLGSWLYRAIVGWGGLLVRNYYAVEMRGEEFPKEGPALIVQNHTNGLADAHFSMVATRRPIRLLVKYKLIRAPFIGWLLRRMDAVPMYRKKDGVDTRQNAASFEAIDTALRAGAGAVIAIFPEGESLNAIKIRPLKSGVARMAVSAERSAAESVGLRIVPVGVTYEERDRFRSSASAIIGEPIEVAPILATVGDHQREAIKAIMHRVRASLESLTLHAESEEEYRATVALERILPRTDMPLGLRRQAAQAALHRDQGDGAARRRELIEQLAERLAAAGLSGDDVMGPAPPRRAALVPLVLFTPLAALSLVIWGLPAAIALRIAPHARTPDKVVTLRLLFTFAGLLVWIPALLLALGLTLGLEAALIGIPVSLISVATFARTADGLKGAAQAVRRRALARSSEAEEALRGAIRSIREAFLARDPD